MRPRPLLSLTLLLLGAARCTAQPASLDAGAEASSAIDSGIDTMPPLDAAPSCATLFGAPNAHTGLSASRCTPRCGCDADGWTAASWDDARVAALRAYSLLDTLPELTADPYAASPPPPVSPVAVCGVVVVDAAAHTYRLQDFASEALAQSAGAVVTHYGVCGLCSTLTDLAVYATQLDLTAPVRDCGISTAAQGFEADVTCLQNLGFTRPCAQIWAYNTAHTRAQCADVCFALLSAPYNLPDGALNDCLACDEVQSGEVFKTYAGRTRRNSGIASAICRPCSETMRIDHAYP